MRIRPGDSRPPEPPRGAGLPTAPVEGSSESAGLPSAPVAGRSSNVTWHAHAVTREERGAVTGGEGLTVWFTGLSGSGKSTIAVAVEAALVEQRRHAYLLDGDNLRHGLNGNLGFSAEDRTENVRRVGEVARLLADAGTVALVSLVSPYAADRDRARKVHAEAGLRFVEVYVNTPLEECERRDPKGLYAKARAGELKGMTGIDDPYEPPERPELELRPLDQPVEQCVAAVLSALDA
jgi:adenylyl-sulfate kinase